MELNVGSGKKCPNCGGTVAEGRKTCQNCGHSFSSLGDRVLALETAVLALGDADLYHAYLDGVLGVQGADDAVQD